MSSSNVQDDHMDVDSVIYSEEGGSEHISNPSASESWFIPSGRLTPGSTTNVSNVSELVLFSNLQNDIDGEDVSKWMMQLGKTLGLEGPKLISGERYQTAR